MGTEIDPVRGYVKILIVAGAIITALAVGYWGINKFIDSKLDAAQAELDESRGALKAANKEAEGYRKAADASEATLINVKKEEARKRADLENKLADQNLLIVEIKEEAERTNAEYESKLNAFSNYRPSEVAEAVESQLKHENPASEFRLTGADLFTTNETAARMIGKGFLERDRYKNLYAICTSENAVLNDELATVRGMVDSYATELSYSEQSAEDWKQSSLSELAAKQQAESQIQKMDAVIKQLNRKLWWKKIEGPVWGAAGLAVGYGISRGLN